MSPIRGNFFTMCNVPYDIYNHRTHYYLYRNKIAEKSKYAQNGHQDTLNTEISGHHFALISIVIANV